MATRIGFGLIGWPFASAEGYWGWIDLCEAGGVDSIWHSDRLVGETPALECLSAMAALAGRTRRLKFGMSVLSLSWREPLVVAKACATIDYLSGGRLLPAFGLGSLKLDEWAALGIKPEGQGAAMDGFEAIDNDEQAGQPVAVAQNSGVASHGLAQDGDGALRQKRRRVHGQRLCAGILFRASGPAGGRGGHHAHSGRAQRRLRGLYALLPNRQGGHGASRRTRSSTWRAGPESSSRTSARREGIILRIEMIILPPPRPPPFWGR